MLRKGLVIAVFILLGCGSELPPNSVDRAVVERFAELRQEMSGAAFDQSASLSQYSNGFILRLASDTQEPAILCNRESEKMLERFAGLNSDNCQCLSGYYDDQAAPASGKQHQFIYRCIDQGADMDATLSWMEQSSLNSAASFQSISAEGVSRLQQNPGGFNLLSGAYASQTGYWQSIKLSQAYGQLGLQGDTIPNPEERAVIVVADSGLDTSHPALAGKIYQRQQPSGFCKNDYNGCDVTVASGVAGRGGFGNGASIYPAGLSGPGQDCGLQLGLGAAASICAHGTQVASIIAADAPDGSAPYVGVCPNCLVLPVKIVRSPEGGGQILDSDLIRAFSYILALKRERQVPIVAINASFGKYRSFDEFAGLVRQLHQADVLTVGAAGNEGVNRPQYPAAFSQVVAVSNISWDDLSPDRLSNFGEWVDIAAPGAGTCGDGLWGLPAAAPNNQASCAAGTSFASPVVAGIVGLKFMSKSGRGMSAEGMRQYLLRSADARLLGAGGEGSPKARLMGRGVLDASAFIRGVAQNDADQEDRVKAFCGVVGAGGDEGAGGIWWFLLPLVLLLPWRRPKFVLSIAFLSSGVVLTLPAEANQLPWWYSEAGAFMGTELISAGYPVRDGTEEERFSQYRLQVSAGLGVRRQRWQHRWRLGYLLEAEYRMSQEAMEDIFGSSLAPRYMHRNHHLEFSVMGPRKAEGIYYQLTGSISWVYHGSDVWPGRGGTRIEAYRQRQGFEWLPMLGYQFKRDYALELVLPMRQTVHSTLMAQDRRSFGGDLMSWQLQLRYKSGPGKALGGLFQESLVFDEEYQDYTSSGVFLDFSHRLADWGEIHFAGTYALDRFENETLIRADSMQDTRLTEERRQDEFLHFSMGFDWLLSPSQRAFFIWDESYLNNDKISYIEEQKTQLFIGFSFSERAPDEVRSFRERLTSVFSRHKQSVAY